MTISTFAPSAIESMAAYRAFETMKRYGPIINGFVDRFGDREIDSIEPLEVERYILRDNPKPSTARVRHAAITRLFKIAKANRKVAVNPCDDIKFPTPKQKTVEPYSATEVQRMLDAAKSVNVAHYAMVSLLLHTGMRIRDAVTLEKKALKGSEIRFRAHKNDREIRMPIPKDLASALRRCGGDRYFFWTGESSVRTAVRNWQFRLDHVFKKAGVEGAYAHRARHTMITRILEQPGSTMQDAADAAGITLKVAEDRYAQWSPRRRERVAKVVQGVWW